ncbi:MAG TPA: isocitrate/isopropylmalate family dehydrogenase [Candidatus Dormibacteraeota bacterium]|nr:isocitrate/isopropylmalate family dehydrogenase [Candidatus Dormibacteraeota bacterium]
MTAIAVLEGDQTGQELLEQALRVLEPDVVRVELDLRRFDLSLDNRRATRNAVVLEAAAAMRACGYGLKAATITPEGRDDVGSPNAILREQIGAKVIVRTGRRIPGVATIGGVAAPISVVRMAVDDAYNAREWREGEGDDEIALRTERITRSTCRAVAEFAFEHARRTRARVFGGPKFTVSPVYEGMLKEEMDAAAGRHPDVPYEPHLIDATYALLLTQGGEALVVPALNRDGDCLSDFVLQLFGSIAASESIVLGFTSAGARPDVVMAEAPHGTAPSLQGKNIANPMAMILAAAALLGHVDGDDPCRRASRAIVESVFEAVRSGMRTPDLGGDVFTDEFTDGIVRRVRDKLEVWSSLGV